MTVTKEFYDNLPDFKTYLSLIEDLFEKGKTTGNNQSEAMLNYSKLGITRTKRGLKTYQLTAELKEAAKNTKYKNWMVISEAWCGDAGNIVPIIALLADATPGVSLKIMLRDENPEIMENYLTNGGRSIPIFVTFDDEFNAPPQWGPRPEPAQKMVMNNKNNPVKTHDEFAIELQKWYQNDKTITIQKELTHYLS
jgi:hypothetical protein